MFNTLFDCFDPKQCLIECVHALFDLLCQNKIDKLIIGQDVTNCWSISHEIGTQQQRDQCQNFSLGHNFCERIVDCSQIGKNVAPKNYQ